ncbi:sigma-70 family RNA polymerase sigma factor [Herbidospora mongoliensis]|uniref:sigma-70 family RNA polymerase sigma factor n=1 Tax=Herbidospora mongoliensis TaxID=688067 RepID=UPI0008365A46|nr:sigma-70 family RNA polymerase sigma factor [Herbidospora mongoliensis]
MPARSGPDTSMVAAARDGDQAALDRLVADSLPLVYNIVGRALNGHNDTDDVVQETLIRMVRGLPGLRDIDAYRSWLVAIAVRQVRDHEAEKRTAQHRRTDLDTATEVADPASDFAGVTILQLGLTDQRREVAEATRWLDPDDRALLSLWWLEETGELGRADLASSLGISAKHAAVRVQRMKEQIEVAQTVVRCLNAPAQCGELRGMFLGWDGVPSPLWRKRFARHIRGCTNCGRRTQGMVPLERLLLGLPLVAVPAGFVVSKLLAPVAIKATAVAAKSVWAPLTAAAGVAAVATGAFVLQPWTTTEPPKPIAVPPPAVVVTETPSAKSSPKPKPSPSPSKKPSPKPSPKPSKTVQPPPPPPAPASAKKGVGVWPMNGVSTSLAKSGARWYYTWASHQNGVQTPRNVEFVPMIWGADSVTPEQLSAAKKAGPYLLSFNEPDLAGQANMTVERALELWPQLQKAGKVLGSPGVAFGGDTPGGWLDRFMKGAKANGYRVDFVTLHWYGGDFRAAAATQQLKSYLQNVYQRYKKPIWLTEYALIDFSNGSKYASDAEQAAFLAASSKMLASLPYVQRYAWFGLPAKEAEPNSGLFTEDGAATRAGRAFQRAR